MVCVLITDLDYDPFRMKKKKTPPEEAGFLVCEPVFND